MAVENAEKIVRQVVERWKPLSVVHAVMPMTPDASLRRYFRIQVDGVGTRKSVVAMVFDSVAVPEAGGGPKVDSDQAYVELTQFLREFGVAVPELVFDARADAVLLVEDLGDEQLFGFLAAANEGQRSAGDVDALYRDAIGEILKLQQIPRRESFFPFQRAFSAELYLKEMGELTEFTLSDAEPSTSELTVLNEAFAAVAGELERLPRVLVHRDFHSWNLMIDAQQRLRVIDFQDALLATRPYDVVALLNDRDTDSALGERRYKQFLQQFLSSFAEQDTLLCEYDRALLQRDLKVAGRFAKLVQLRGLKQYAEWIPGTQRRLGRTLSRMWQREKLDYARELLDVLSKRLEAVAEGKRTPMFFD